MNQDQFIQLIQKYCDGTCSEHEIELLESWYNNHAKKGKVTISEEDLFKNRNLIWNTLQQVSEEDIKPLKAIERVVVKRLWYRIGAAVAVLFFFLLTYIYYIPHSDKHMPELHSKSEIHLDSFKKDIKLTLADGQVITLNSEQEGLQIGQEGLTYIGGDQLVQDNELSKSFNHKESQEVVLSTPMGESYKIILADGSQVWLNAGSSLTYPLHFEGHQQRRVKVSGEAFFKVTKNQAKPFIVETNSIDVEVLGTEFNVQTYAEEIYSEVTLEEGKVAAFVGDTRYELTPNRQLKFNKKNNKVHIEDVHASDVSSWREGYFIVKATSLDELKGLIKRWYQVDVVLLDEKAGKTPISGVIYKDEKIADFMNRLERTAKVKWHRKGNNIYIKN